LDRDGTIAPDVPYCSREEDFELYPGAGAAIKLFKDNGFKVVVITNQSGLARGYFTEETLGEIHNKLRTELKGFGVEIDAIYYCPHHPNDGCDCRKPGTALFRRAAHEMGIDIGASFLIGDSPMDIRAGRALGCRTVMLTTGTGMGGSIADSPDFVAADLAEAAVLVINAVEKTKAASVDH
jgi:histidinol-phosphate phosphatase family protein